MTAALIYGASSGALHAVTGPDHVLSLGTVALQQPRASWKIGLNWGVGHALGTLLLAVPVLLAARAIDLPTLAAWGDRIAGLALLATTGWSFHCSRRASSAGAGPDSRAPLWVGLVHGISGAGSLLLLLPVIAWGSPAHTVSFLLAFAFGSAFAMSGLTAAIAKLGSRVRGPIIARVQRVLMLASAGVGGWWLLAP